MVFSTNPDFEYHTDEEGVDLETPAPERQNLRVRFERAGRGGKTVTIVSGFVGKEGDLKALCKTLKTGVGTGGSAKDGEMVLQGDCVEKAKKLLRERGYKVK